MDSLLLGTATAFGLAASAGLNTTIPLLIVGLLARVGLVTLAAPYDAVSSDIALAGLVVFAALEFAADKIPGADTIVHTIQLPLAGAAGAILFASHASVITQVSPGLAVLVGLLTAGAIHGVRASIRPAVTGLTAGLGNPIASTIEDGYAAVLALTAVLLPGLGLILLLLLLVAFGWLGLLAMRTGRRAWRRLRGSGGSEPR